ncbi:hypothetical protein V1478_005015 [Vespula squamosa]|uniref:Uncharacterized protein n=1 Tax=Vespula squamosa TaxID=30214 RepID=A0ABD2BFN3_VESSQ
MLEDKNNCTLYLVIEECAKQILTKKIDTYLYMCVFHYSNIFEYVKCSYACNIFISKLKDTL